jgi:hypothetical protein
VKKEGKNEKKEKDKSDNNVIEEIIDNENENEVLGAELYVSKLRA